MIFANLMIVVGAVFIALGGILATRGWHERTTVAQRNRAIRSVAAEWMVNVSVLRDRKFSDPDDANLAQFVVFPRTQTAAMGGVIASGLFTGKKDRAFLTHVSSLNGALDDFNRRLAITEDTMRGNLRAILTLRKKLRDGSTRTDLLRRLGEFGQLLLNDYGIRAGDEFFISLDQDTSLQADHSGQSGEQHPIQKGEADAPGNQ